MNKSSLQSCRALAIRQRLVANIAGSFRRSRIRSRCRAFLVLFAAFSFAFVNIAQTYSKENVQSLIVKGKLVKEPQWKATTLKVYRDGDRPAVDEDSKEATYEFWYDPDEFLKTMFFPITAFVVKNSGNVWIGPRNDVYIDTASGVIGLKVNSGAIMWMESFSKVITSPYRSPNHCGIEISTDRASYAGQQI